MDCTLNIKFFTCNSYDGMAVSAIEMDDGDIFYDLRYMDERACPGEPPGWYITIQSHSTRSKGLKPPVSTLDDVVDFINSYSRELPPSAEVARRVLMWCQNSKPHPKLDVEIVSLIESLTRNGRFEVHRVHDANPASQH